MNQADVQRETYSISRAMRLNIVNLLSVFLLRLKSVWKEINSQPDLTMESFERLERKHSPKSVNQRFY
jgi:hypothetical protein